ncbi:hypothetical protein [Bacteroides sp.]|uniref:hypothetical protein n=1 Tax=Bacteroides sp. TaxID=29523 RepID=UPI003A8F8129
MKENRYALPTDKLVNRLVPYYLSGRKYILFLQSLVRPLRPLSEKFRAFALEKHIEARMTSQMMYFEWYLNRQFARYLINSGERIVISESDPLGVDIYHEGSAYGKPFTIWYNLEEVPPALGPEEKPREFHYLAEEKAINKVSFMVLVPQINIPEKEFVYMLSFIINTYKVAGKTYLIKIDRTLNT